MLRMGNHGSKTFPAPQAQPSLKTQANVQILTSPTVNVVANDCILDAKLVVVAPTPASETVRKQRSPRETPDLYVYASYRNWELVRKQIELSRGLDYVSTNRRFSVLHISVESNAPVDIIRMLIAKGVDPNVVETLFKQSPLHILMKIIEEGNTFQIMKTLVEAGADVNSKAKYGRTPLYCAIKYRVPDSVIVYLLRAGAVVLPEELIFAREKSTDQIARLLEKVSVMTIICSSRLKQRPRPLLGSLPTELLRELNRYLYHRRFS